MTATDADWVVLKNDQIALPKDLTVSPTQGADRTKLQDGSLALEGNIVEGDREEADQSAHRLASKRKGIYDMSDSSEEEEEPFLLNIPFQVQPFNIELLATLVEATSSTLEHLKGQNVVIVLGKTGTGKSTLMHAIAGRQLTKRRYRSAESGTEKDVYGSDTPLEGFNIGHEQKSTTKCINHFTRGTPGGAECVVYVDSAGFEDTSGMEVDIATAVSFQKIAEVCNSLRFVVLVSCGSFFESKGGNMRSLVRLVSELVGSKESDIERHRRTFTFIFTHLGLLTSLTADSGSSSPTSLAGEANVLARARQAILVMLMDTECGTDKKEESVRRMLKWLRSCLTKGFPFVGLFHPELSSGAELACLMEQFSMADGQDGKHLALGMGSGGDCPAKVVRCCLSTAHQSTIRLEVDRLRKTLEVKVQDEMPEEAAAIARMLAYLRRHIALPCIADCHVHACVDLEEVAKRTRADVYRRIVSGVGDPTDCGFSATVAERVRKSLAQLRRIAMVRSVLEEADLDHDGKVKHGALAGDEEEREAILNGLAGKLHRLRAVLGKEVAVAKREKEVVEEVMAVPLETESAKEEKEVKEEEMMPVPMETDSAEVDMEMEKVVTAVPMETESAEEGKAESEPTEEPAVPPVYDEMDRSTWRLVEPVKVTATADAGPMGAHHARTERLASVKQGLAVMRAWAEADREAWGGAADEGERAVKAYVEALVQEAQAKATTESHCQNSTGSQPERVESEKLRCAVLCRMECARTHFDSSLLGPEFEPASAAVQAAVLQALQALVQSANQTLAVLSEALTKTQSTENPLSNDPVASLLSDAPAVILLGDASAATLARVHAYTQAFRKACMNLSTTLDALAPLFVQPSSAGDKTPLLQVAEAALVGAFAGAQRVLEESFKQVAACVADSQMFGEALRLCMEVMQGLDAAFKDAEKCSRRDKLAKAGVGTCGLYQAACTKVWEKLREHRTVLTLEMDLVSTRDVKRQVGALTALKSAEWFDAHYHEEVEPVCAGLEAFTHRHLAHLEATVRTPLVGSLAAYLTAPTQHQEEEQIVGAKLGELRRLEVLYPLVPKLHKASQALNEDVMKRVSEWAASQETRLEFHNLSADTITKQQARNSDTLLPDIDAQSLEEALRGCGTLAGFAPVDALTVKVHRHLEDMAGKIRELMQGEVCKSSTSVEQNAAKRHVLDALQRCRINNMRCVLAKLPTLEEVQGVICEDVDAKRKELLGRMTSGQPSVNAEKETLNRDMAQLKQLVDSLGSHVKPQMVKDVDCLFKSLEMEQSSLVKELRESITSGDYDAVADHLAPMLKSNESKEQPWVRDLMRHLAKDLSMKVEHAQNAIRDIQGSEVKATIKSLADADRSVGSFLKSGSCGTKSLNVGTQVVRLTQQVSKRLKDLLTELEGRLKELGTDLNGVNCTFDSWQAEDYRANLQKAAVVIEFYAATSHLIIHNKKKQGKGKKQDAICERVAKIESISTRIFEQLDSLLQAFVTNVQKVDQKLVEQAKRIMLRMLCGLKEASGDPAQAELAEKYQDRMQRLGTELYELHVRVQEMVAEGLCSSAVEMYAYLQRAWEQGLQEHVPPSSLQFNIATELEKLQDMERVSTVESKSSWMMDEASVQQSVKKLDRLRAAAAKEPPFMGSVYLSSFFRTGASKDYEKFRSHVLDALSEGLKATEAEMNAGRYEAAAYFGQAVKSALTMLQQHVLRYNMVAQQAQALEEKAAQLLSGTCEQLCRRLSQMEPKHEDGMVYDQFYKLYRCVRHLGPVFSTPLLRSASSLRQLHTVLCAHLEKSVKTLTECLAEHFIFRAAADDTASMRKLGHVLSGIWPLYCRSLTVVLFQAGAESMVDSAVIERIDAIRDAHFGRRDVSEVMGHYIVLGVPFEASLPEIKAAFKRKSREVHPDKLGGSAPHDMQQEVNAAFEALQVPAVRQRCIRQLALPFRELIKAAPRAFAKQVTAKLEQRDYSQVGKLLQAADDLPLIMDLVDSPLQTEKVRTNIHNAIRNHVRDVEKGVWQHWEARELQQMHDDLGALERIDTYLDAHHGFYDPAWTRDVKTAVCAEIDALDQRALGYLAKGEDHAEAHLKDLALVLISLGQILDDLPMYKDHARIKISNVLDCCQSQQPWGFPFLFKLGIILEAGKAGRLGEDGEVVSGDQRVGRVLVSEFRHFRDVETMRWNEEITQKSVQATAGEITAGRLDASTNKRSSEPVDQEKLLEGFCKYQEVFDTYLNQWLAGRLQLEELANKVLKDAAALQPCSVDEWTETVKDELPSLLGGVFAYFTIHKSGDSYKRLHDLGQGDTAGTLSVTRDNFERVVVSGESGGQRAATTDTTIKTNNVLLKPHNIQVLTVLRMLGYDAPEGTSRLQGLQSHVMQIRTGEGKSIVLGACSVVLGMLGFSVRCVCYSEYLSCRDYELFKDVFDAFQVGKSVHYSTIRDYAEHTLQEKGDIRKLTRDLVSGTLKKARGRERSPEVLLVDEVDVFFGKDFYGKTWHPVAYIEEPEAREILECLFQNRLKFEQMEASGVFQWMEKESQPYQALLCKFTEQAQSVLRRELWQMCCDLKHYKSHVYHYNIEKNQIGYKHLDGVTYRRSHGYLTAFSYLKEAEDGNLRNKEDALQSNLKIHLHCGTFSHANISPDRILGVSGTMDVLGAHEWEVMGRFGIKTFSHMPSVYGKSNFRFLNQSGGAAIIVEDSEDDHFRAIAEEVKKTVKQGRAVVVYFSLPSTLQRFTSSTYYQQVGKKHLLEETQTHRDKDHVIKKAATSGQATFATAIFGRGTDFVCLDKRVLEAGGVHVIQTFVSQNKAEEVQIQGRTARQGKDGTYSLVLSEADLVIQLGIQAGQAVSCSPEELYRIIDEARADKWTAECKQLEEDVMKEVNAKDALAHQCFDALLSGNAPSAMRKFKEANPEYK